MPAAPFIRSAANKQARNIPQTIALVERTRRRSAMRDYGTMFLAVTVAGLAAVVLGLMLVTAHSESRPPLHRIPVHQALLRPAAGNVTTPNLHRTQPLKVLAGKRSG